MSYGPPPETKLRTRRELGARLRSIRKELGITAVDLSIRTGINRSQISRMEHGRISLEPSIVKKLAEAMGAKSSVLDELAVFAHSLEPYDTTKQATFPSEEWSQERAEQLELTIGELRLHVFYYIPALFQMPDYAVKIFEELTRLDLLSGNPDQDVFVVTRLKRQAQLYDRTKRFIFVIPESIIRLPFLDDAKMASQLDIVICRAQLSWVNVHVLPANEERRGSTLASFQIHDDTSVVHESPVSSILVRDPKMVLRHRNLFDDAVSRSFSIEDSIELISTVRDEFTERHKSTVSTTLDLTNNVSNNEKAEKSTTT